VTVVKTDRKQTQIRDRICVGAMSRCWTQRSAIWARAACGRWQKTESHAVVPGPTTIRHHRRDRAQEARSLKLLFPVDERLSGASNWIRLAWFVLFAEKRDGKVAVFRSPGLLDRKKTIDSVLASIEEAVRAGASLLVFPEAYVRLSELDLAPAARRRHEAVWRNPRAAARKTRSILRAVICSPCRMLSGALHATNDRCRIGSDSDFRGCKSPRARSTSFSRSRA